MISVGFKGLAGAPHKLRYVQSYTLLLCKMITQDYIPFCGSIFSLPIVIPIKTKFSKQ